MDFSIKRMYIRDAGDILLIDLQTTQSSKLMESKCTLQFYQCEWRILQNDRILIGSRDCTDEQEEIIPRTHVNSTNIIEIQPFNNNLDWRIVLPNNVCIEVFSTSSHITVNQEICAKNDGFVSVYDFLQLMSW